MGVGDKCVMVCACVGPVPRHTSPVQRPVEHCTQEHQAV